MINTVDVFKHKPAILQKAENYLNDLKDAMVVELKDFDGIIPANAALTKSQLARGENHKGFPYRSLDIPQIFSKTEMFTYRVLFWWGNFLAYSLILKGKSIPGFLDRLVSARHEEMWDKTYLSTAPSPWEWTETNFVGISGRTDDEIRNLVESIQYIKLCHFFPVSDDGFPSLNWVSQGIKSWRILSSITTR